MKRTLDHDITDLVDADALRREVQEKYREVAADPTAEFHFHTGRAHALRMGYPESSLDQLPDEATEAFAGVANPFYWGLPLSASILLVLIPMAALGVIGLAAVVAVHELAELVVIGNGLRAARRPLVKL